MRIVVPETIAIEMTSGIRDGGGAKDNKNDRCGGSGCEHDNGNGDVSNSSDRDFIKDSRKRDDENNGDNSNRHNGVGVGDSGNNYDDNDIRDGWDRDDSNGDNSDGDDIRDDGNSNNFNDTKVMMLMKTTGIMATMTSATVMMTATVVDKMVL